MAYANLGSGGGGAGASGAAPSNGVGIAPAVVAAVPVFFNFIGGLFSDGKDAERRATSDQWYAQAVAGDEVAEAMLRCHAGETSQASVVAGYGFPDTRNDGKPPCAGWATATARAYAQGLVLRLRGGDAATGVFNTLFPRPGINPLYLVAGIGVVAFLVMKRSK